MDQKLSLGSSLGPYKIIRLIGKGGMGEVYEAYEEVLQRSVALKIITDEAITGIPEVLRLFLTEGKALAQLNHPNVVTIYQLGQDKGVHYIAMEYIEGIPLDEHIRNTSHDLKRDLSIFYRILLGVQALHKKGIIHRDLKPKNVIIQGDKIVKIVDFGIAEILREPRPEDQENTVLMGSVYYMSPEVSKGGPATFQSDIWSLGVLLFQLMTRERPFTGKTQTEILSKIRNQPIALPSVTGWTVPGKYKAIAFKMCHRSLSERYQSVDEIITDLGTENKIEKSLIHFAELSLIGLTLSALGFLGFWQYSKSNRASLPVAPAPESIVLTAPAPPSIPAVAPPPVTPVNPTAVPPAQPSPLQEAGSPVVDPVKTPMKNEGVAKTTVRLEAPRPRFLKLQMILKFSEGSKSRSPAALRKAISKFPVLEWRSVANARSYFLQLSNDESFTKIILSKELSSSSYEWSSAEPGKFFWRVRAHSKSRASSSSFSETGTLQVLLPAPVATQSIFKFAVKASEKDAQKNPQKNTVTWKAVPLATQYQVTLSKKQSSAPPVLDEVVRGQQLSFSHLVPGVYELQIVALDSKRQPASLPSPGSTVQILSANRLVSPKLQQPSDGTSVPSQGTMITPIACLWSPVQGGDGYEYQLASDSAFRQIVHQTSTTQNQYVLIMPLPKGKFFWRVRATSKSDDSSLWSQIRFFKID